MKIKASKLTASLCLLVAGVVTASAATVTCSLQAAEAFHSAGTATLQVSVSDAPEPNTFGLAAVFLSLTAVSFRKRWVRQGLRRGTSSARREKARNSERNMDAELHAAYKLVMRPAAETSTLALGKPRFLLFHALKASARISTDVFSRFRTEGNLKFFDRDQSALTAPGPRSIPTEAFPTWQQTGTLKALGLYQRTAD